MLCTPRRTFLFSGHMLDAPARRTPRFPPAQEAKAAHAIRQHLLTLQAGPRDLAISSGACGGDLLFAEAALSLGVPLEVYLPFDVPSFEQQSVAFAGPPWSARYHRVLAASTVHLMPVERPPLMEGQDPFEQANLWMLEAAGRFGPQRVRFIALWNGQGGDGPGGTQHMMSVVRAHRGQVRWINTTQLWS